MGIKERINLYTVQKQNSILSASLVLAITFAISALLGFLRSRFLYSHFFTCCTQELDAYNAAFRIPDLIFKLLVTGALSASFIPVFSSYLHKDEKTANQIASTVINLLAITFFFVALFVLIFTYPLSRLIAAGFTQGQLELMVGLTRILLIAQIFFLLSNFLTGILQVHQIFIVPAVSPIVYNFFIILSIFTLAPKFGIYGVTYGAVIGSFFHLAIQIPIVKRIGFSYYFSINTHLAGVREIIKLMIPRSISLGLGEIQNTVTLFFASTLTAGSISLLNLALQLMYLPSRIFGTTIGQASLPILSKSVAKNELSVFRKTVEKTILQSLFLSLPIATLVLILRVPIVRIAFGAKQFPWSATLLTAQTLAFLTPSIVCQAIIQILVRSFYALHNTKTPLHVSIVSLLINGVTSAFFIMFSSMGIVGLALSASIGNLVQLVGLLYMFVKMVDGIDWSVTIQKASKIALSSVVTALVTWVSVRFMDIFIFNTTRTLNLVILFTISSIIGLTSYIVASHLIGVQEYKEFRHYLVKLRRFILH